MTNSEEFDLTPADVDPDAYYVLRHAQALAHSVGQAKSDPLVELSLVSSLRSGAETLATVLVRRARQRGDSWDVIAGVLSITRQSAWERYRHVV